MSSLVVFMPDKSLIISACSSKDPTALGFSFSFLLIHFHLVWPSLSVLFCPNFNIYFLYLSCPVLFLLCSHVLRCPVQLPIPVSSTYATYFEQISVQCFYPCFMLHFSHISFLPSTFFTAFHFWVSFLLKVWAELLYVAVCYSDWGVRFLSSLFFLPPSHHLLSSLLFPFSFWTCSDYCFTTLVFPNPTNMPDIYPFICVYLQYDDLDSFVEKKKYRTEFT